MFMCSAAERDQAPREPGAQAATCGMVSSSSSCASSNEPPVLLRPAITALLREAAFS
eukprot:CAMPEP_0183593894 /NCGR_PEP_ID=MMETSP0371-20130417/170680_1 /TAXON_ID=268820 /ORGANISM="Peridinium aciculiferum, Strain PAER-2" /LENGTH=56 /DNA_ID=CAMNT_0025805541 /DNA_START=85 /DNA_END=252 /DNA_ORIENTATION=+